MKKNYYIYLIISKRKNRDFSYVGYTSNLTQRIRLHNEGKRAKFTKGNFWKLIYKKKFKNKSLALKNEYKLKKDYKLRKKIKDEYLINE